MRKEYSSSNQSEKEFNHIFTKNSITRNKEEVIHQKDFLKWKKKRKYVDI